MNSRKASIFKYNIILYHQSKRTKRKFYKQGEQKQKDMNIYTLSIKITIYKSVKFATISKKI